ncbi:glycosyltransferase family 4 protein [Alkalibacillus haloalkaliphilus]|uniref:glycosyltransferase family 4 protein n=1 Tax=Alkalibacillus haloalkaliphilus TaxID=94136 RepID=UPI0002F5735F|nr:glycosyltransferase family 4 protein [Alkalibacillus haloalkaliphilus]
MKKTKILIMTGHYLPSVKAGGPVQSIKNLVDNLSDSYEFYILTSDRDIGDSQSFQNIDTESWQDVGNAKVYYVNPSKLGFANLRYILGTVDFDILYINSFFSFKFSIMPLILKKLSLLGCNQIVLAPRGEFSPGALKFKKIKKKIYFFLAKAIRLYKGVKWHATAQREKKDIEYFLLTIRKIIVAENMTNDTNNLEYQKPISKNKNELKIVFVSRIHPKKNLLQALDLISQINRYKITFNIYGPIEDQEYWSMCETKIKGLPTNVKVNYFGSISHNEVHDVFKRHHVFLFPTFGENYGHVISEAFLGACPVIVSDQTPWRNLELSGVGWDIPLTEDQKFLDAIEEIAMKSKEEYLHISKKAFEFGIRKSDIEGKKISYFDLFNKLD